MLNKTFAAILIAMTANCAIAQNEKPKADSVEVTVKIVTRERGDSIIVDGSGDKWVRIVSKPKNVTTSWWGIDLGFANYVDNTNYASAEAQAYAPGSDAGYFDLRNGKSVNVNIWFFNQRVNLIKHVVNLKYAFGLELNNYRYRTNIRYIDDASSLQKVYKDVEAGRSYKKDKLAADYLTVPIMLNFNFVPSKSYTTVKTSSGKSTSVKVKGNYGYGFSAGMSVGYLYSARNKFITSDEGKRKIKDDFDLSPWKISYVGEVNLGYLSLYGSYAAKSMYKRGLDMTPYNVGFRFGF